jgi:pimeloyl-ACP methyl ester carboxylesterase
LTEVVLLHGAGGGAWEWDLWRGVFEAAGLRCHVPELQPVAAGLAATRLDDYRAQVLSDLPQSPCALIGASLGGLLALMLAEPVQPAALVLVNPMPPAPLHAGLPARAWPDIVPWGRERSLAGTRRSLFDADDATCLVAFRRWRDESGAVLRQAQAGVALAPPRCPVLVWVSEADADVPPPLSRGLAALYGADLRGLPQGSHVGPLLGGDAARCARQTVDWLNGLPGLQGDSAGDS